MTAPKTKTATVPVDVDKVADDILATAQADGIEAGKAAFVDAATAILTETPVKLTSAEKTKTVHNLGGAQETYCDVCGSGTKNAKTGDVVHEPTCSVEMTPEQIKAMDRGTMYEAAKREAEALKTAAKAGRPLPKTPVLDYMNSVDASTRHRDSARANGHKPSASTGGARVKMTDEEIAKVCKPIIDGGVTNRNAVIKAFRAAGHSASWQRVFPIIEPMIAKAPKTTTTTPAKKAPATKKAAPVKAAAKTVDVPNGTPGPKGLTDLMNPKPSTPKKSTAKKAPATATEIGKQADAQKRLATSREAKKATAPTAKA